jgi:hypothetical protein
MPARRKPYWKFKISIDKRKVSWISSPVKFLAQGGLGNNRLREPCSGAIRLSGAFLFVLPNLQITAEGLSAPFMLISVPTEAVLLAGATRLGRPDRGAFSVRTQRRLTVCLDDSPDPGFERDGSDMEYGASFPNKEV